MRNIISFIWPISDGENAGLVIVINKKLVNIKICSLHEVL